MKQVKTIHTMTYYSGDECLLKISQLTFETPDCYHTFSCCWDDYIEHIWKKSDYAIEDGQVYSK